MLLAVRRGHLRRPSLDFGVVWAPEWLRRRDNNCIDVIFLQQSGSLICKPNPIVKNKQRKARVLRKLGLGLGVQTCPVPHGIRARLVGEAQGSERGMRRCSAGRISGGTLLVMYSICRH